MKYETAWYCVECDHELTNHERMYSYGRCPYCGYKSLFACTIVETYEAKRGSIKEKRSWWQFWK